MAGDGTSTGIDNESAASHNTPPLETNPQIETSPDSTEAINNFFNQPSERDFSVPPDVEQKLREAVTKKYANITVNNSAIRGEPYLTDINLKPDLIEAKKRDIFEKLFDARDLTKSLQTFEVDLQIRENLSDFIKNNFNLRDNLEPLDSNAKRSMMEKWLGTPSTPSNEIPNEPKQ
ncbi:MAG TPA: hypothetical protein VKC53_00090 [Patescibacteria group bacterium]|nr:hypothetical protein [Patescibacteria group bacterium]